MHRTRAVRGDFAAHARKRGQLRRKRSAHALGQPLHAQRDVNFRIAVKKARQARRIARHARRGHGRGQRIACKRRLDCLFSRQIRLNRHRRTGFRVNVSLRRAAHRKRIFARRKRRIARIAAVRADGKAQRFRAGSVIQNQLAARDGKPCRGIDLGNVDKPRLARNERLRGAFRPGKDKQLLHGRIGGKAVLRAACGAKRIPRAVLRGGHLDGFAVLERRHARAGRVEQIVRALERHKARLPRAPVGGKAADGKRHPSGQAVDDFLPSDFARRNGHRARGFVDRIRRGRARLRKRVLAGRNAGKQRHAVRVRLRLIGRAPVLKREARARKRGGAVRRVAAQQHAHARFAQSATGKRQLARRFDAQRLRQRQGIPFRRGKLAQVQFRRARQRHGNRPRRRLDHQRPRGIPRVRVRDERAVRAFGVNAENRAGQRRDRLGFQRARIDKLRRDGQRQIRRALRLAGENILNSIICNGIRQRRAGKSQQKRRQKRQKFTESHLIPPQNHTVYGITMRRVRQGKRQTSSARAAAAGSISLIGTTGRGSFSYGASAFSKYATSCHSPFL